MKEKQQLNRNGNKRGLSPNSQKNLLIGQKANNHAKKKFSLTACAREKLDEKCPYKPTMTWREYLVDRWLALAGENASYFKELIDRLEGKTSEKILAETRQEIIYKIEWDDKTKNTFTDTAPQTVGIHTVPSQAQNN